MILRQLLWKQWRENRFHFWCFTAWMAVVTGYAVGYEMTHHFRMMVGTLLSCGLIYCWLGSAILSVHTARNGGADPTNRFTGQLPVAPWKYASVRLAGAVLTLVVPLVLAMVVMSAAIAMGWVQQAELRVFLPSTAPPLELEKRATLSIVRALGSLWTVGGVEVAFGVQLLLLTSIASSRLKTQAQIGLMGGVLGMSVLMVSGLFWEARGYSPAFLAILGVFLPGALVVPAGYGTPQGHYLDPILMPHVLKALAAGWIPLIGLAVAVVRGFSTLSRVKSAGRKTRLSEWAARLGTGVQFIPKSPIQSLILAESRQALPLGIFGFGVVAVAAVMLMLSGGPLVLDNVGSRYLSSLPHSAFAFALLWSAVVGSALFSAELAPGLGTFWRSRPISTTAWFWIKFGLGLVAVLGVVDGTVSLVSWNAPRDGFSGGMSWAFLKCMPIQHAWIYSLAVYGTCRWRKPVLGGVVAVGGFFVLGVVLDAISPPEKSLDPTDLFNSLIVAERSPGAEANWPGYFAVYGGMVVMAGSLGWWSSRLVRPLR